MGQGGRRGSKNTSKIQTSFMEVPLQCTTVYQVELYEFLNLLISNLNRPRALMLIKWVLKDKIAKD